MTTTITPDQLLQFLASRRTVRDWQPHRVERARIEALIEAAVTAPSASNKQAWRFFVVDERERLQAMARSVQERLDDLLALLPADVQPQVHDYGQYFVRFADAPVVIAAAYRPLAVLSHLLADVASVPEALARDIDQMEQHSGVVSVGLAIQNLLLAAHAAGLGASCLAGPLIAVDALKQHCEVPQGWTLACLVALGHPLQLPSSPGRKQANSVTRWVSPGESSR